MDDPKHDPKTVQEAWKMLESDAANTRELRGQDPRDFELTKALLKSAFTSGVKATMLALENKQPAGEINQFVTQSIAELTFMYQSMN